MNAEWIEISRWLLALLGLIGVLSGVWITSRLNDRRETQKRRYEFIARQLSEFYAPMVGLRAEIRARGEISGRISESSGRIWQALCAERQGNVDRLQALVDKRGPEFSAIIDHENEKFEALLLPAYRKMLDTFRDKLWLAEADTRAYFPVLVEYLDVWDRWMTKSLPREVLAELRHSEAKLYPLYDHLQAVHDRLRAVLARGEP